MRKLRLGLAQINTLVGDLKGNAAKIKSSIQEARSQGVDLVSFPELALTGYPPEDLLLKPGFVADNLKLFQEVVASCRGIAAVVGFVDARDDLYNAAGVIYDGHLAGVYHKTYLPTYGVFDEDRYFQSGNSCPVFVLYGAVVGVNICEDIWHPTGPTALQARGNASIIVNINASPYHRGKRRLKENMLATRAADSGAIVAYTNLVGGQDELVFDGASMIFNERGEQVAQGHQFAEDLVVADVDLEAVFRTHLHDPRRRKERTAASDPRLTRVMVSEALPSAAKPPLPKHQVRVYDGPAEVYQALVLSTRDYVLKNGFKKVVIGLSGGIDSSLVAAIAVDALGPENVAGVSMPSRYSSSGSKDDAALLAQNLGFELLTISIEEPFQAYLNTLSDVFSKTKPGVAEENLQARTRGNFLMALSNKFGWLVLTTGNKSELATGYATLYGDMAGGFAVIKDVPKTLVYDVARYLNAREGREVIPQGVLDKPPSAELRPNQKDTDSLPPYEVLDPILQAYVEEDRSPEEIVALGFDEAMVRRIVAMVDRNEYKRRQSPPGVKITPRAFGKDWRLPITSGYHPYNSR